MIKSFRHKGFQELLLKGTIRRIRYAAGRSDTAARQRTLVHHLRKRSVSEAARQLRISRQTLHRILKGSHGITPEMAVRLGKFCGNGPGLWLRMQQSYDLWQANQKLADELRLIPAHQAPQLAT